MAPDFDNAIREADAILLLVKHNEFANISPQELLTKTKARIVLDAVNAWNKHEWQKAGFLLHRLGDNKSQVYF